MPVSRQPPGAAVAVEDAVAAPDRPRSPTRRLNGQCRVTQPVEHRRALDDTGLPGSRHRVTPDLLHSQGEQGQRLASVPARSRGRVEPPVGGKGSNRVEIGTVVVSHDRSHPVAVAPSHQGVSHRLASGRLR